MMLSGTFITEVNSQTAIEIPSEIAAKFDLCEGDKVEVMIKKIKSRRMEINISKNPLQKLLEIKEETTKR